MLKENYKGKGSLTEFIEDTNKVFSGLNNATVRMPDSYAGEAPRLFLEEGAGEQATLVMDMKDALVFTLNNIEWKFTGSAVIVSNRAYVDRGKLHIEVHAVCP